MTLAPDPPPPISHIDTPRLVFLHLPRTGGTTLIYEHLFNPAVAHEVRCHANYDEKMREVGGDDPLSWSPERRAGIRVLVGHIPFDLGEHFEGPSEYVTMLRDPMTRTVSDYSWCRSYSAHELHSLANEVSLVEFVEGRYSQTTNCYTRALSGATFGKEFADDDAMLAAAERTLDRCKFVGITECFDEFVSRLCARYSFVRRESQGNRNVTSQGRKQLSPRELEVVRQHNELDIRMYERRRAAFLRQGTDSGLADQGGS